MEVLICNIHFQSWLFFLSWPGSHSLFRPRGTRVDPNKNVKKFAHHRKALVFLSSFLSLNFNFDHHLLKYGYFRYWPNSGKKTKILPLDPNYIELKEKLKTKTVDKFQALYCLSRECFVFMIHTPFLVLEHTENCMYFLVCEIGH